MAKFKMWIVNMYHSMKKKQQKDSHLSTEAPVQHDTGNVIYIEQYRRAQRNKKTLKIRTGKL